MQVSSLSVLGVEKGIVTTMSLADRYKESITLTEKSRTRTPGGAQTMSKRPEGFCEGAFPAYLMAGHGARVLDVDGHEYVDWICGLGAVPLGYNHLGTNAAIMDTLHAGLISSSLPTQWEEHIASRLCAIIPCAQDNGMVRFVKTGSEACAAAVRIARRATRRDLVIVVGYHGWHDWVMQTANPHPGVVEDGTVFRVPYNDPQRIEDEMRHSKVAAVMLEPTLLEAPKGNYLSDVVTLCTLHGAVSIFDEMVTGFRWAPAGGQEYFGVTPDMAVFGKGLANGMPLACVVGPERLMQYADVISGTFGGEVLSLAAAGAVLDAYEPDLPVQNQWRRGFEFKGFCQEFGIPFDGYAVHPKVTYTGQKMALFLQETARRGLLLHPSGFNVSAALTEQDMEITRLALQGAKEAMDAGVKLEGLVAPEPIFRRNT